MFHAAILDDRSVIVLKGPEARPFLQGLVTNDMARCADGQALYAALLTPQGKILFDFFVAEAENGGFLIDCAAARAADLVKRLSLYRLRAKVEIALAPELCMAALWNGETIAAPAGVSSFADPRHERLGLRLIGARAEVERIVAANPRGDYHAHRIALGIPDSTDLRTDTMYALDAGLEELNGVDFKKGCYVGQEVTARMKHRSSARRRFLVAELEGALPPPGTPLQAKGHEIGTLSGGTDGRALALVRLDRLAEALAEGATIEADGHAVTLTKPDWLDG